jgi:hypothetical protein
LFVVVYASSDAGALSQDGKPPGILQVGLDLYAVFFLPHPGELNIFYLNGVDDV